jgi:hypothetical protein
MFRSWTLGQSLIHFVIMKSLTVGTYIVFLLTGNGVQHHQDDDSHIAEQEGGELATRLFGPFAERWFLPSPHRSFSLHFLSMTRATDDLRHYDSVIVIFCSFFKLIFQLLFLRHVTIAPKHDSCHFILFFQLIFFLFILFSALDGINQ